MKFRIFILMLVSLASVVAQATTPKSIYVFGESFSDSGNFYYLLGEPVEGHPMFPIFTDGRIGDGPNWVDYIAENYKHVPPMEASSYGGANYAIFGSGSGFDLGPVGTGSTGLQLMQFLNEVGSINAPGNVIIAYWIGGNDLISGQDIAVTMSNIHDQLNMLIDAGALHFLVPNMVPAGFLPAIAIGTNQYNPYGLTPAEVNSAVAAFNAALEIVLNEIKCNHPQVHLYAVDAHQLMLDVLAAPATYGFENITEPALLFGGDPDVSLWWDLAHFTSRFQFLLAEQAIAAIDHHGGGLRCDTSALE